MSQKSTLVFLFCFFFYNSLFGESVSRNYNSTGSSVRGQVARIMMSGLGGAVFGVSTLSFYGEPQKHLGNVAFGAAVGLLIGSVYVTSESLKEDYSYVYSDDINNNININNSPLWFLWTKQF